MSSFEAHFVDGNYAALVQRVTSVMAIADELKNEDIIHEEKYAEIRAEQTSQGKMRKLFEALNAGGHRVKNDFYYALRNHEPYLFRDLAPCTQETEDPCNQDMETDVTWKIRCS
ncbi:apoptosis-associated speck-like protein containing a CARD [Sinocyclocheilus anshuiensis]|uniref:apoptosis-associated speck-like protein containing a CARD n=1 Tax=Sinocyclocheilus anshuiensis TaxID=1608454 RepID=UPI0007BA5B35|nr:PREDICTED: apoptosis-associated speck-like protein containing a CARD [Sinocyclocheilus anshuiensis]